MGTSRRSDVDARDPSEAQARETALEPDARRLEQLFERMELGFAECEAVRDAAGAIVDCRFVSVNPAFRRLSDKRESHAAEYPSAAMPPELDPFFLEFAARVVDTQRVERIEQYNSVLACWYQATIYPLADNRFAILLDDITERKHIEMALRASEERFRSISELGVWGMCFFDDDGVVTEANQAYLDIMGCSRADLRAGHIRWPHLDAVGPLDAVGDVPFSSATAGRVDPFEKEYHRQDGSLCWALVAARRIESTGEGAGFVLDITQRIRAEQRQALLAEISKAFLSSIGVAELLSIVGQKTARHFGVKECLFHEVADGVEAPVASDGLVVTVVRHGRTCFQTSIVDDRARAWPDEDVELLKEITERVWARLERARAEATLQDTQQRLDETLAFSRMAYWVWDPDNDVIVGSKSLDDLFGVDDDTRIVSIAQETELVHPADRARRRAAVLDALERGAGWECEFRIIRPRDRAIVWLTERATVTRDLVTGAPRRTGLVWDVTDRKRAEAMALREREAEERDAWRRELAEAEEAERRRLAREIHDQLGQHLTALTLGTAEARRMLDEGRPAAARLAQLEELARALMSDARYLAVELRPPELDDVGLESALHTYVQQWSARYGVPAEVSVTGPAAERALPTEMGTAIYRIVQEALTNVARHAGARQVSILLEKPNHEVRLIVEDDGRGFDVESTITRAKAERRLGVAGMRERAVLLGGALDIESTPGHGTTVYVRIPYDEGSEQP